VRASVIEENPMKYRRLAIAAGLLIALASHAASPRIDEGEWEFQSKMDMPGMPPNMPAQTFKACMSKDNPVPQGVNAGPGDQSCKTTHQFVSSDTATWTVRCTRGDRVSETKGKGTYRGSTMEATQTFAMRGQTATTKITGRRVGPCKQ
jgi:hypothetical protein